MPLRILAGPGCDAIGKDAYLEDKLEPGDVTISIGRIFKALTGSSGIPSENPPVLRLALGLRAVAIRSAKEKELNGWILTSSGARADLDRLVAEAGADHVDVLKLTEAQACARVSALVPKGAAAGPAKRASSPAGLNAISQHRAT